MYLQWYNQKLEKNDYFSFLFPSLLNNFSKFISNYYIRTLQLCVVFLDFKFLRNKLRNINFSTFIIIVISYKGENNVIDHNQRIPGLIPIATTYISFYNARSTMRLQTQFKVARAVATVNQKHQYRWCCVYYLVNVVLIINLQTEKKQLFKNVCKKDKHKFQWRIRYTYFKRNLWHTCK